MGNEAARRGAKVGIALAAVVAMLASSCNFPRPIAVLDASDDAPTGPVDASDSIDTSGSVDASVAIDGPVTMDAPVLERRCDPSKAFGAPALVPNVNSSLDDSTFSLASEEKVAFVGRVIQPPGEPAAFIVTTQRTSTTVAFDVPSSGLTLAINNVAGDEHTPSPASDALILYFHRQTSSDIGIFAAIRADPTTSFSMGARVTVDGAELISVLSPTISDDGQTLYWLDFNDFGKVLSATRGRGPTDFVNKRAASTIASSNRPVLSADELTLYYYRGTNGDVLVSTRASKADSFGTGVPVANVNSPATDIPMALTKDGCILFIASNRPGGMGGYDIWEAHRPQ